MSSPPLDIRVTVDDRYLISARGCLRPDPKFPVLIPISMTSNPIILNREVQEYLLSRVGMELHMRNSMDRIYYPEEMFEDIDLKSAVKVGRDERKWSRSSINTSGAKVQKYVSFYDEEIAMEFLFRYGTEIVRKNKPV